MQKLQKLSFRRGRLAQPLTPPPAASYILTLEELVSEETSLAIPYPLVSWAVRLVASAWGPDRRTPEATSMD